MFKYVCLQHTYYLKKITVIMNINLCNRSHDTNVSHETRTNSVDIPLPLNKTPKAYGININSLPIKKRLVVLMNETNHTFNETTSTQPIMTNLPSSININPVSSDAANIALDIDDNSEVTNKAVEKSSLLSVNENDNVITPHKRSEPPLKEGVNKKRTCNICTVAETSNSSEIVNLGIQDVGDAEPSIQKRRSSKLSHLSWEERKEYDFLHAKQYDKKKRKINKEHLAKLETKTGSTKKTFNKSFVFDATQSISQIQAFISVRRIENNEDRIPDNKMAEIIVHLHNTNQQLRIKDPRTILGIVFTENKNGWIELIKLRKLLSMHVRGKKYAFKHKEYLLSMETMLENKPESPSNTTTFTLNKNRKNRSHLTEQEKYKLKRSDHKKHIMKKKERLAKLEKESGCDKHMFIKTYITEDNPTLSELTSKAKKFIDKIRTEGKEKRIHNEKMAWIIADFIYTKRPINMTTLCTLSGIIFSKDELEELRLLRKKFTYTQFYEKNKSINEKYESHMKTLLKNKSEHPTFQSVSTVLEPVNTRKAQKPHENIHHFTATMASATITSATLPVADITVVDTDTE